MSRHPDIRERQSAVIYNDNLLMSVSPDPGRTSSCIYFVGLLDCESVYLWKTYFHLTQRVTLICHRQPLMLPATHSAVCTPNIWEKNKDYTISLSLSAADLEYIIIWIMKSCTKLQNSAIQQSLAEYTHITKQKRPNTCYIFEKEGTQGYQICHSGLSSLSYIIQWYQIWCFSPLHL